MKVSKDWFAGFGPASASVSVTERLRGSLGAFCGILLTGVISSYAVGMTPALPMLIAPMGASAVLLFAVPSSPLAQPWSIIGGNLVAGLVGVSVAHLVPAPILAAPIAVGVAIGLMVSLRCIHPPSGAVALTAVLGGPTVAAMGYRFVLWPVLLNSVILMLVAIGFNTATRRRYPHAQTAQVTRHGTSDPPALRRFGFSTEDLDRVLRRYDQILDVSRDDMDDLFQQAEIEAYRRRFATVTCADIMSRDVISVEWGAPLQEAWTLMRKHRLRAMPVVDRARHVLGMVNDVDFMNDSGLDSYKTFAARFHRLIQPPVTDYTDAPEVVGQIMVKTAPIVPSDTHIALLVPILADSGARHVPIIDKDRHLVGLVSQSDLIAALYQSRFAEADGVAAAS